MLISDPFHIRVINPLVFFLPASPIGVVIPVSRLRSNPNAHIGKREEEDQLLKSSSKTTEEGY
jgi:hypothetical protein